MPRFFALLSLFVLSLPISAQAAPETHHLDAGQRLTLVLADVSDSDEAVRSHYIENGFPIARRHGMADVTAFPVEKTLMGDVTPQFLGLYSWPSAEASRASRTDAEYVKRFKPLRQHAWRSLDMIDVDLEEPLVLNFEPGKRYTLAVVWIKDRDGYEAYYRNMAPLREKLGIQVVLSAPIAEFDSLTEPHDQPSRVVLLEWPDDQTREKYLNSPELAASDPFAEGGVSRLDWYQMGNAH